MYIDREKNRKDFIDKVIINDNSIVEIPEENVYMEFVLNDQTYIAFSEGNDEDEEIKMLFAKVENMDGKKILRNIETEEELETVLNEFYKNIDCLSE